MKFRFVLFAAAVGHFALDAFPVRAADNVMSASSVPPAASFGLAGRIDSAKILPPPPVAGSLAASADLEAVRQAQVWRTEEQVAWAKLIDADTVYNHAAILGSWFTAERLPKTAAFFKQLDGDVRALDGAAKKPFLRPRPMTVDPTLKPCVRLPTSTGYPSGSALQAYLWAELLAEAVPAKREALLDRAHRAAWGRIIGGVHFPTDIEAGRVLANAVLEEARKDEAFRTAWAAARDEIAAAARVSP